MGGLVDLHPVQLLVAGAGVVDFVKVKAVQLADGPGHKARLIAQRPAAGDGQRGARRVPEGQLHHHAVGDGDGVALPAVQGLAAPCEGIGVAQFHVHHGFPICDGSVLLRRGNQQPPVAVGGNARVDPHLSGLSLHLHREAGAGSVGVHRVLGGGGIPQIPEADCRREGGQPQQSRQFPGCPAGLRRAGDGVRLGTGGQRRGMAVGADVPHREGQQQKAHCFGKAHDGGGFPGGGGHHPFVLAARRSVGGRQIHEPSEGQPESRAEQPHIVEAGGGQQHQQHAGNQIPLMHAVGEGEHPQQVKACQQQRREGAAAKAAPRQPQQQHRHHGKARHTQHLPCDGAEEGALQRLPVAAQRRHPVEGVHRGIGITGRCTKVFFPKSRPQAGQAKEGQRRRQHRAQRRGRPGQTAAQRGGFVFPGEQRDGKAQRQHRPGDERLRLDGQRKAVAQRRRQPAAALQQQKTQDQRQAERAVDLFPRAGVEQQQRIKGGKGGEQHGGPPPRPAAGAGAPHQRRTGAVAQGGHQRKQQIGALVLKAQMQRPAQLPHQPQHIQIAGGIVRKIALAVKGGGAAGGQLVAPRHKAAHVVGVALHHQRQQKAQQQRSGQNQPEYFGNLSARLFHGNAPITNRGGHAAPAGITAY